MVDAWDLATHQHGGEVPIREQVEVFSNARARNTSAKLVSLIVCLKVLIRSVHHFKYSEKVV
jgi:hypothetical protein